MADLAELLDQLQAALVPPTTAAASLPDPADLAFERTLSRRLAKGLDQEALRILTLASAVLDWAAPPHGQHPPRTELDPDLVREGLYNNVVERVEPLLEHADDGIEKHLGIGKHRHAANGPLGAKSAAEMDERTRNKAKHDRLPARLLHDASIDKPQKRFSLRTRVAIPQLDDDGRAVPLWKPVLRRKINALDADSDASWLETELYEPSSHLTVTTATVPPPYTRYTHPYAREIAALAPPPHFLAPPTKPEPHAPNSFDKVPFDWVGDAKALERLVDDIRKAGGDGHKELAIDLEHHDFRAWAGTTCLIQLSTRSKDYVIDALEPTVRDNLDCLNEFFTDPEWIKVLHGASSDIVWLQRDFGLYIVGLFDTYHATKVLGYSQHSLASLLAMYTDFEPDKRYQLADWRIRPLPKEMLHYARSDTHFLLSIYDHLRLALHDKAASSSASTDNEPSPLQDVFDRSRTTSSIVFSLPPFDAATGHFDSGFLVPLSKQPGALKAYATALAVPTLPIKTGWGPSELKLECLRAVVQWREQTARDEDESARYVLSVQGALQLAELGAQGRVRDARDIMQALGAARGGVSDVVRRRKDELAAVVAETVERVAPALSARGAADGGEDVEMSGAATGASVELGLPAEEPAVRPAQGIWGDPAAAAPVASTSAPVSVSLAAQSSFFGGASPSAASTSASGGIVASSSTFFGGVGAAKGSSAGVKKGKGRASAREEAQAAVRRVHEALTLGGGLGQTLQLKLPVPEVDTSAALPSNEVPLHSSTLPLATDDSSSVPTSLSADHAYVPLSGRIPKQPSAASSTLADAPAPKHAAPKPKDSDVIVVSALADKPKKRRARPASEVVPDTAGEGDEPLSPRARPPAAKKAKKAAAGAASSSSRPAAGTITPHDYTSQRSVLDAEPVGKTGAERRAQEKSARKKEARAEKLREGIDKGKGTKGIDTSEFGRAPRVNNAPKKGNATAHFAS
ncbi:hypothetical protein JCM8208_006584 [Rhodotorula glutinis]